MAASGNWVALAMLGLGTFAIGTDSHFVIGILDLVARDLGVSGPQAGQLVTLFSLTYAISAPIFGWLLGGFDRRVALLLAALLFIAGNAICGIAVSFPVMAAGRVLAACGAGMYVPLAFAVASDLAGPARRGVALSIIVGGMTLATALGVPAGTFAARFVDWQVLFFAIAGIGAVMLVLLAAFLPPLSPPPAATLRERLLPAGNPRVLAALLMTFLVVLSEFTLYAYIGIVFAGPLALVLPAVLLGFGIGSFLGNLMVGFATDRFGPRRILLGAVTVQTLLLPAIVLVRDVPLLPVAIAFAWGVVSYMYLVPIQHRLVDLSREAGPMTLSLNSSAIYLGIAGGGALGGGILAFAGPDGLAAGAAGLGAMAVTIILRRF